MSRRRKQHFSFETLEARQVMSAAAIVEPFQLSFPTTTSSSASMDMSSLYSSLSAEQQAALDRELSWYAQMGGSHSSVNINSAPNDPLFQYQWHLLNTGQNVGGQDFQPILGVPGEDINVTGAWNLGYTGAGVTVAVLDSGVQLNHPDLIGNINTDLSFDALMQSGNGNPIFSMFYPIAAHGTAVAGLIGAVGGNGIGGVGVAPGVELAAIRLIDFGQTEQAFVDAFRHTIFNGIDITNNSWSPGVVRGVGGPTAAEFLALRDSVLFGREGKGVIHVFAAGNDGGPGFAEGWQPIGSYDSSAYNGWVNNRYTIGVTGVDHDGFYNNEDGTITPYPEISTAILVAAPTGSNAGNVIANDTGLGSGLWTTDLTGDFGFNAVPDPNGQETRDPSYPFDRDFLADPAYTSRMNGTSAAAPLVSGVIALMLEANPELTWRDVQEILVRSARQNAPFGIPQAGQDQGGGPGTQNTWIVNQIPIFRDLDFTGIVTNAFQQTLQPTQDPNFPGVINGVNGSFHPDHDVATPHVMTNGAGYTVSQGRGVYGEWVGYGHGVVDAELAVRLAEQWHTKNQALAPEQTFTSLVQSTGWNLPGAEQGNDRSGWQLVPGGIGGRSGFISLWNEHFADMPNFNQVFPYRGDSSVEFNVPASRTMSLENVEVKISISGGAAAALDGLRVMLVSPDGTHSELNNYWMRDTPVSPSLQPLLDSNALPPQGSPGSVDTQGGNLVWTFRSTRHWGERTNDAIVFDPTTGMPAIDQSGIFQTRPIDPDTGQPVPAVPGEAMTQGWRVVIENWGATTLGLAGIEIAWHGQAIDPNSQRITGAIGIDEDENDDFNFSRVIRTSDGPTFGSTLNIVDVNQEDFAENVTVVARRVSDNQVVDRFVTGHDGNFYFDLVPDEYIISIEDPEGRAALDDSLTPAGLLQHYKTEWHITPEHFKVWQKQGASPHETVVDANGVPIPWLDANGNEQEYGIKGLNFLLDPGDVPLDQVSFSGTVYADTNGDGVFNSNDVALPNVQVYVDANQNGSFESGEVSVLTDAAGQYTLVQMGVTAPAVMNVGVVLPAQWTATNPSNGLINRLIEPGEVYGNFNFFIDPPANNLGGGGVDQPGFLLGTVFEDLNGDGVRNGLETNVEDVVVWLDANNNGTRDAGEAFTETNANGAYVFHVAPGEHRIRVEIASPLVQTTPAAGQPWVVTLIGSSTISDLQFGYIDLAVNDWGDLPREPLNPNSPYRYDLRPDGAGGFIYDPPNHKKGKYWLGASVDGELGSQSTDQNGQPLVNADGDDNDADGDDDDGVVFDPIVHGTTGRITVTANTYTGYLQGWVDWNNDGDFLDDGERIVTDQLLVAGQNFIFFNVPDDVSVDNVYARFRFGEHSTNPTNGEKRAIDTPWGFAKAGEVEDYYVPVADPAGGLVGAVPGDFDGDEDVDGSDFLNWQRNVGKTTGATRQEGDADADGDVDGGDLDKWQENFGPAAAASGLQSALGAGALVSTASAHTSVSAAIAAWPTSTVMSSGIGSALESAAASARPGLARAAGQLADLAERLGGKVDRAEERITAIRERLGDAVAAGRMQFESMRRDQAFDDLFASLQNGPVAEAVAELTSEADSDEAFAELADHFGWDQ